MALSDESGSGSIQQALDLISSIPPGVNAYAVLVEELWKALVPDLPQSFVVQLYVLSGVLGLCFLLVTASMIIQAVAHNFWLVRSRNGLWRPHWSLGWSSFALFLLLFLQVQIWETWMWSKRTIVFGLLDFKLLPWVFSWTGGHTAAWGLGTSYILNESASGHTSTTTPLIILSNTMSILVPAGFLGALLPFWIRASISYRAFLANFASLIDAMESKSATFNGSFSIADLLPYGTTFAEMYDQLDRALVDIRKIFIVFAACSGGLVLALVTIAFVQLMALSRALRRTKPFITTLESNSNSTRERALVRSFNNLKYTVIAFSLIALCFIGICSYVAIRPRQSFTTPLAIQITTLLPLYNIAVFGLPTAILLFRLSLDGWRLSSSVGGVSGGSGSGGNGHGTGRAAGRIGDVKSGTSSYSTPDTSSWHQKLKKNRSKNGSASSRLGLGGVDGGRGTQSISIMCAGQTLSQLGSPLSPTMIDQRPQLGGTGDAYELDAFERHVVFPEDLEDVKV
ncbi:hypothetical protein OIO90_002952 [Microbotryomycetes sp. JL221]|nr:hypothetical protein OIO90_002952 [Microbotryomycetes sp. JL221]